MKNILSLFVLVPTFFGGINNLATKAQIPQGSFQQVYIEGNYNQVTQALNQNLNLNFIDIPDFDSSVIPNFNIQGTFLDNPNNQVVQGINQSVFKSNLIPLSLTDLTINDFIGYDNVLNGGQFNEQSVFIEGDDNIGTQLSYQNFANFFLLEKSELMTETNYLAEFIGKLLESQLLDSFQFSSQDTLLFGNHNIVQQSITQNFDVFIFSDFNYNPLLENDLLTKENSLKPVQFTIQETFINVSENNYITQNIHQSIENISVSEFNTLSKNDLLQSLTNNNINSNDLGEFPIDIFVDEILNNTIIESQQINRQVLEVIGNNNESSQENEQILDLITNEKSLQLTVNEQESIPSIPEPSNLKMLLVLAVMIWVVSIRM
ncbi:MAG: hypothetical protein QNJ64_15785 [Crocosphaera sp.]|nr:hypothetical protein [Crocosphaera sp.]